MRRLIADEGENPKGGIKLVKLVRNGLLISITLRRRRIIYTTVAIEG
ncbi:hypothetical protein KM917_05015 [Virgibacillus pantothenticus]|nr:hypothetical protein [Virgibacillus pantothenticus]MBU8642012.1 hypothetical protein [Virgibacillus pantothenticus]MBU8667890.1 hypothetical protein [Virgibacillus pantothenticus]MBU8798125.1 hypothetical protein [Virgibacillus pantothenticus]MEB5468186.1 hypothetical protein [Virgibacillus pantothenticus]